MEQHQDYEKKLNEIRAIPDRLVKSPKYPVDVCKKSPAGQVRYLAGEVKYPAGRIR
jgi:hypothetical protein